MGSVVEKIIGGIQSQYSRLDCTSRGGNLSKHTDLGFRSHRFCCESDPIGAYWGEGKPVPYRIEATYFQLYIRSFCISAQPLIDNKSVTASIREDTHRIQQEEKEQQEGSCAQENLYHIHFNLPPELSVYPL